MRQLERRFWDRACPFFLPALFLILQPGFDPRPAGAQENKNPDAPVIQKVEPPSWWVGLSDDLVLLLSGNHLAALHASCNLPEVVVSRTQSSADGNYLFLWMRFSRALKSGTAVCRITTAQGQTSFELPIATRKQILGRNQGLAPDDVIYRVLPDPFQKGAPARDVLPGRSRSPRLVSTEVDYTARLNVVRNHLHDLKDLGVSTVRLPLLVEEGAEGDDQGDAGMDLYAVDPRLGNTQEFALLVEAAHQQHLKVFSDLTVDRVAPSHPWVQAPPTPDWFRGFAGEVRASPSEVDGNFYGQPDSKQRSDARLEAQVDPHITAEWKQRLSERRTSRLRTELNTENPLVRDYLVQNSIWWAESSGLDGFCIEAFPRASRAFWEEWHKRIRKIYPRLSTVGAVTDPDPTVTSFFAGGRTQWDGVDTELTALFDYPLYFSIRGILLGGAPAGSIANVLRQDALYPHPDFLVTFLGNQNTPPFLGLAGATVERLKLASGLVLTLRGIPELDDGDSMALSGTEVSGKRRDSPGQWTGDAQKGSSEEGRAREQEIFSYLRTLLGLRRGHDALQNGRLLHLASDQSSYVFLRTSEEEKLLVAFQGGARGKEITLRLEDTPAKAAAGVVNLFGPAQAELAGHEIRLRLPAESLSIFLLE